MRSFSAVRRHLAGGTRPYISLSCSKDKALTATLSESSACLGHSRHRPMARSALAGAARPPSPERWPAGALGSIYAPEPEELAVVKQAHRGPQHQWVAADAAYLVGF